MTTERKRGTRPGAKFSAAHRRALSRAHRRSDKVKTHLVKARAARRHTISPQAHAASRATYAVRREGLSRQEAPERWQEFFDRFLAEVTGIDGNHQNVPPNRTTTETGS